MKSSPEQLFHDNLRLAYHFGYQWVHRLTGVLEAEDILQLAMLGLWKACLGWDPDRGQLSTLAAICIRNECLRAAQREGRAQAGRRALVASERLVSSGAFAHPETAAMLASAAAGVDPVARRAMVSERQEEAARALGVSQTVVSRHLRKARQKLEAALS